MKRLVIVVAMVPLLAACGSVGEANNYNVPVKGNVDSLTWVRLDSPSNYPTIVRACYHGDGIYLTQDTGQSVEVVPNDPGCVNS